ncbi:MAG: hypothetical protein AVDCRST_MAG88-4345, partial [uncultured Thermomicrobiales bacterium]
WAPGYCRSSVGRTRKRRSWEGGGARIVGGCGRCPHQGSLRQGPPAPKEDSD